MVTTDHQEHRSPIITGLRHVDLGVPDLEGAVAFYRDIWGLSEVATDAGVSFFAAEGSPEQYVLRVRSASENRLDLISFSVDDASAVDSLATRLEASEVAFVAGPDKLDTPGGGYGFRFFDVDGRVVEVSAGVAAREARNIEPRESIPRRLSHVVLNSTDVEATKQFYEQHLDFKLTDWLETWMCFLRAGDEHHLLAISAGPHTSLNHVAFELRGIDEYMRATGRMIRAGQPPVFGPGRHAVGDNTFSYFQEPNGNVMEYTTELERIEDENTWEPRRFEGTPETADQWGTGGQIEEFIPVAANQRDTGVWIAPPF